MVVEQLHIYESKHFYGLGSTNKIMFVPFKQKILIIKPQHV